MPHAAGPHPSSTDGPDTLLFVCAANVCRSPTMEFLTRERLRELGVGPSWHCSSAGTIAAEEAPICVKSASALKGLPGGTEFAKTHRARRLTTELVDNAALILVATRKERSALARISAPARSRTFTMLEAALLVESAVANDSSRRASSDHLTLEHLAALMHSNRGLLTAPASGSGDFFRPIRRRRRELDIPDFHTGAVRDHRTVVRDVRWASDHLTQGIAELVRPSAIEELS